MKEALCYWPLFYPFSKLSLSTTAFIATRVLVLTELSQIPLILRISFRFLHLKYNLTELNKLARCIHGRKFHTLVIFSLSFQLVHIYNSCFLGTVQEEIECFLVK